MNVRSKDNLNSVGVMPLLSTIIKSKNNTMSCPSSTESTPRTSPKRFSNWARKIDFTANTSFQPTTRGEIVSIIQQAESENRRIKWTGSLWSFTESFISNDLVIESGNITGEISPDLILNHLPLLDSVDNLIQIKGGTKIYNINRILHGLSPSDNGGGSDEINLDCGTEGLRNKALPTLGGSGGQSIAGLLATGSHGGDINLTPMADAVVAIHLIGPGGQEWWIERNSDSLTNGNEAEIQENIRNIATTIEGASVEICSDIIVKKDDDFFNSVLVSVGRMGFIYSLVIRTRDAFKLVESRRNDLWENLKTNLTSSSFDSFIDERSDDIGFPLRYLQILINPFSNSSNMHECKVAERHVVPCSARNVGMDDGGGFDPMGFICRQQDVRVIIPILLGVLAVLGAAIAGLIATAGALAAIPFVGWALAAAAFAAATALGVTVAALSGLVAYLSISGRLTSGELVAAIANFAYSSGMKGLMKTVLGLLFNSAYPIISKLGVSWKIMDTYGYAEEDFCQKVDSMEFAFDLSAASINERRAHSGYLGFLEEVFTIFDDLFDRNIAVAGLMAIRYTRNTNAKIGMSKFTRTCHIEIPILQNFGGNSEFLERVQNAAIRFGGIPHWGQIMNIYNARNIRNFFRNDLTTWRRTLRELIREVGSNDFTFSNNFTSEYNLEPLEEVEVSAIEFEVTVGGDSLGDTDWLRQDVSQDFMFVNLIDGRNIEVSLNEGSTWNSFTTHTRRIDLPAGIIWSDIDSVGIRHIAAGNDWNADNWGMNRIIIFSIDTASSREERFSQSGNPIWYFQKNENQIWEHFF